MRITAILIFLFALTCALSLSARAQLEAGPAWQVLRYDITASTNSSTRALIARTQISIRNVGRGSGERLTLRINSKAEIKSVTVNDAVASYRVSQDVKTRQQKIEITLPVPVTPNVTFNVVIEYQMSVTENSSVSAISPLGAQFLPLSYWYPTPANALSPRGADTAAFRLRDSSVAGDTIVSSGKLNDGTFDQSLSGQPFFLSGAWDVIEGPSDARGISAYLPKGATVEERKQAIAIVSLAGTARTHFAGLLGSPPDVPLRLVFVTRGGGFGDGGTLLLDAATLRRSRIDVGTATHVSDMIARLWIGGATAVRAEGHGVIQEGLVRHLSTSFIEKQYGIETAEAERIRQRTTFSSDAKRDAPLSLTTPLDASYFNTVGNKGSIVWRLVEQLIGHDAFVETLRTQLQRGSAEGTGMTLVLLKEALSSRGGEKVRAMLRYQLDQTSDTDLLVGLPQLRGNEWVVALRNVGAIDVSTNVVATTESGERLNFDVVIPARNFAEAVFKTNAKLKHVEVDPQKLYPQVDYANDVAPRLTSGDDPYAEAARLMQRQDFARAESLLRELLTLSPNAEEARVLLARTLLAESKFDQAEKEFRTILALRAPTAISLAWANVGLGDVSMQRGQAAAAARYFDEAVRIDADYATSLTGRRGRIKAEVAGGKPPVPDESARSFVSQLDKAIVSGRKAEIDQLIVTGELTSFAKGVNGSQPELWQTQVLRTEQLDSTRMAVDVHLNVKQLNRELSGSPVLILARIGGSWKLMDVAYFDEVR
jgi:hypothetical protein